MSFPGDSSGKEPSYQCRDIREVDLIPGSGDPLEKGMASHSSILAWRIPMDRGAWEATVHRVGQS